MTQRWRWKAAEFKYQLAGERLREELVALVRLARTGAVDSKWVYESYQNALDRHDVACQAESERLQRDREDASDRGRTEMHEALRGILLASGATIAASLAFLGQHGADGWRFVFAILGWCALTSAVVCTIFLRVIGAASFGMSSDALRLNKRSYLRTIRKFRKERAAGKTRAEDVEEYVLLACDRWLRRLAPAALWLFPAGLVLLVIAHASSIPGQRMRELPALRETVSGQRAELEVSRAQLIEARALADAQRLRADAIADASAQREAATRALGDAIGRALRGSR